MLSVQSSLLLFVANPIEDIQMVTEPLQWQHVSKGENAVDLISSTRRAIRDHTLVAWTKVATV